MLILGLNVTFMIVKCHCMYCQGPIEFDLADFVQSGESPAERLGQKVECPHCKKETVLAVKKKRVAFSNRQTDWFPSDSITAQGKTHLVTIAIGAGAIILLIILFAFVIHDNPGLLGRIGEGGISLLAALIGGALAIVGFILACFWIIFPWMVYTQLKRIEANTRPRIEDAPAQRDVGSNDS